ncbi:MAG: Fic family protein [Methanobacteriota archaeon]
MFLSRCTLGALPDPVWKRTAALDTWGTNAIEGNTLGRGEVERILLEERTVGDAPVRDVLETIQHDRAFRSLAARLDEPVTARLSRDLHAQVFRGVHGHAGTFRTVRVRISGSAHEPPRPEEVPLRMDEWERELALRDVEGEDPLALAAWMHWRFEAIHPFADGNGRVGRLLLNHFLLRHNWPPAHVLPDDRDSYVAALQIGNGGDLSPFRAFLEDALARSLLDLLDQVGTKKDELAPLRALGALGPYDAKYLALRAAQGALPAVKVGREWRTSPRAIEVYVRHLGR